ncbi:MAG TPA: hypothetical protein VFY29_20280 [Terriglobia bacterium]|nr:hypothetical protein [Terriglobia bacterium]
MLFPAPGILFLCAILVSQNALSQAPAFSASFSDDVPTLLSGGAMGELTRIYSPRNEKAIESSLDFARDLEQSSINELDETTRLEREADGRVRIMKEEIETSKVRRDIAKKAKEPAIRRFDDAVKQQERELKYLKQVQEALRVNSDRLESDRVAANTYRKALELELDVARRRGKIGPSPAPEEISDYRDMLGRLFQAQKTAADRWVDAGKLRKRAAEQRIKGMRALERLAP